MTTIWLTGLPSSGKTTLAKALAGHLHRPTQVLDGDEVRRELFRELGFDEQSRRENIRRVGWMARMVGQHGVLVLVPVIAPYRDARAQVRAAHEAVGQRFAEVYVDATLSACVERDVKGLYARRTKGMTGVDAVYEPPLEPDLHLRTDRSTVAECVDSLVNLVAALDLRELNGAVR